MLRTLLLTLLILLLLGCANERAITGGPEDKEAPTVISASPENESVLVSRKTQIVLRFSEQMQPASFSSALQIWPRPPGGFKLKSSWTWLKLTFEEALDSNETYLLTLDKGAKDLRGNGLSTTYVLAFSTGRSLNSGRIEGTLHGSAEIRKNGELYLFRKFDTALDELRKQAPDYIFQPDDDGLFVLPYLAERSYMLFHHWDRNYNKLIDGGDYFGRPVTAAVSARSDSLLEPNDIWPRLIKPKRVKLLQASALGEGLIRIRADRPVTPATLKSIEVQTQGVPIPILGSSNDPEDEFAMIINTAIPVQKGADIWIRNFLDSSGFSLNSDTIQFVIPAKMDTLLWLPPKASWFAGTPELFPGDSQAISLTSNLPMLITSDSAYFLLNAHVDSLKIQGHIRKRSSMNWLFLPDTAFTLGQNYRWQLQTRFVKVPLNSSKPDSVLTGRLNTISPDSLGTLTIHQMSRSTLNCELVGKGVNLKFLMKPGIPTLLENLPAQTYTLSAYIDENGDGYYNSGGLGPAAGAEPFWFFPDEIRIRARWETDLGLWRFR